MYKQALVYEFTSCTDVIGVTIHTLIGLDCIRANSAGGNNLPSFSDPGHDGPHISMNPIQVIIKSYEFHCCGKVEGWAAFVEPGGRHHDEVYTIRFQIWRPTGSDSLVKIGENEFQLVILERDSEIIETPPPNKQLQFQRGDVIGYYLEQTGDNNGGIQFDQSFTQEELWYKTGNSDLQNMNSLNVGIGGDLMSSTNLGPIISVSIGKYMEHTNTVTSHNCNTVEAIKIPFAYGYCSHLNMHLSNA